jgi:catechol 2,3-dioxygenase
MSWGVISEMGFITVQTTRLDESVATARDILGLRENLRVGNAVYMAADALHHEIVYIEGANDALDHISLAAPNEEALAEIRRRVTDAGYPIISDQPLEQGVGRALSFVGPEGFMIEVYTDLERLPLDRPQYGPDRYGHINLQPVDVLKMRDFFVDILDFRVSDVIGTDGFFLRCNSDHHGIALLQGRGALHHHAWQTQSIAELGKLGDRLNRAGQRLLWGPVRHGAGHNIAAYFREPSGAVVELYTDMEQIYDADRPPIRWESDDMRWFNQWSDYRPDGFRLHGIMPVQTPADH